MGRIIFVAGPQSAGVQVHRRSPEPHASGPRALRPAEDSCSGWRHGDLPWDLSHRRCFGGNALQVSSNTPAELCLQFKFFETVGVPQGFVGTVGPLARIFGFGQHDSVLFGHPWTLPCQRNHKLPHTYLLVHFTGTERRTCDFVKLL